MPFPQPSIQKFLNPKTLGPLPSPLASTRFPTSRLRSLPFSIAESLIPRPSTQRFARPGTHLKAEVPVPPAHRFPYLDKKKIPSSFPRPCTHLEAEVPDLEPLRLQGLERVHLALVTLQLSGSLG